MRAGLVERAQDWRWSSAARDRAQAAPPLDPGPVLRPAGWLEYVNTPQTEAEVEALRECIRRRRPYGDEVWADRAATHLGLEASRRPRGRPRKPPDDAAPLFRHTKGQD